jgi:hypothetical protein
MPDFDTDREYYSVLCNETNPLQDPDLFDKLDHGVTVALADKRLVRIERLRLIGYHPVEWPEWEVSYCIGVMDDGRYVRVDLGDTFLRPKYREHLVELCKSAGRYGKDLGIFDAVSTLPG